MLNITALQFYTVSKNARRGSGAPCTQQMFPSLFVLPALSNKLVLIASLRPGPQNPTTQAAHVCFSHMVQGNVSGKGAVPGLGAGSQTFEHAHHVKANSLCNGGGSAPL